MKNDFPAIDIKPDEWDIVINILQKYVPTYEVWVFGSRAKGTAKPYSDLDLCIITEKPLPLSVISSLCYDFSESDLPWKVDVVEWANIDKVFKNIIEKDRVVVQHAHI